MLTRQCTSAVLSGNCDNETSAAAVPSLEFRAASAIVQVERGWQVVPGGRRVNPAAGEQHRREEADTDADTREEKRERRRDDVEGRRGAALRLRPIASLNWKLPAGFALNASVPRARNSGNLHKSHFASSAYLHSTVTRSRESDFNVIINHAHVCVV
jgi:hypothetical protein